MLIDHYTPRINLVQDYITDHLKDELKLEELSRVAGFSPFHFHRIFKDVLGETVNNYVTRQRLERALSLMQSKHPKSLTEIGVESGFRSLSDFSRTFRQRYGVAPRYWDMTTHVKESKIRQIDTGLQRYTPDQLITLAEDRAFKVELESFPATQIAYIRVRDSYSNSAGIMNGFETLMNWSSQSAIAGTLIGMSQDDPDVTPAVRCRYDICITLPSGTKVERGKYPMISTRQLPSFFMARLSVRGDIHEVDKAWQYLTRYWLPRSGFFPENLPAMEIYRQSPTNIGWETFDLDCAVPLIS